jgi:hypothetical protein
VASHAAASTCALPQPPPPPSPPRTVQPWAPPQMGLTAAKRASAAAGERQHASRWAADREASRALQRMHAQREQLRNALVRRRLLPPETAQGRSKVRDTVRASASSEDDGGDHMLTGGFEGRQVGPNEHGHLVWVRQALVTAALPNIAHLAGWATDVCTAATVAARFSPTSVNSGAMAVTGDGAWYVYASLLRGSGAHAESTLRTTSLATPVQLLLFSGASLSSCDGLSVLVLDGWVVCQPSLRLGTGLGAINQLRMGLDEALEQLAQYGAVRHNFLPPCRLYALRTAVRLGYCMACVALQWRYAA